MSQNHIKIPFSVCIGGDELELTAVIEFSIAPGSPARGPSYASGGEPAEPAEIDYGAIEIEIGGKVIGPAPQWLADFIADSQEVYEKCGEESDWGVPYRDPDAAYERMRDDRD